MNILEIPPGAPGTLPKWTSSAKIGVGTAMTGDSNIWFTLSHGIINEVYFPHVDIANIRDMEFVVTDGKNFFSEEKRDTLHEYELLKDGVPAYKLTNTCLHQKYRITKTVISDPRRNVLLQHIEFFPLEGKLSDYKIFAMLAPHIYNAGAGNHGWCGEYKGVPALFAERSGIHLSMMCSTPFIGMNCGYVGISDSWHDLLANKKMTKSYREAENGNIALCAEIPLAECGGRFTLGLGFGYTSEEAGLQTRTALSREFDWPLEEYVQGWDLVQEQFMDLSKVDKEGGSLFRISTAVLKTHEGKHFSGSVIASLSIPWGSTKGDHDLGGYHLIWPRDQVQTALAFLAAGDLESAREALLFLMCTQENDGRWAQCMWENGCAYWRGLQLDETALPILLADHLKRVDFLKGIDPWQMVKKAAIFLINNGPSTQQDRWEENGGYTPFTIATQIAALLCAADFFEGQNFVAEAAYLREVADFWYDRIDSWMYVENTALCKKFSVDGYYVRIRPTDPAGEHSADSKILIRNRPEGQNTYPFYHIVSVDALALVRYGLRKADDLRMLNTIKVIDGLLLTETPKGPVWHRYNEDGYGEHDDGTPFNGTGHGRGWPLLCGERAHYELERGNRAQAIHLLRAYARFGGAGGMISEQVWDLDDLPEKKLYKGHSAGSAKPLVWAHAEYVTLLRSIRDGKVFNRPLQTEKRYLLEGVKAKCHIWRFDQRIQKIPKGMKLRIQTHKAACLHWSADKWETVRDDSLEGNKLGIYYIDLPVEGLAKGAEIAFTFFWSDSKQWEGADFCVNVI